MGKVLVDGQAVDVGDDERINAIQAAERAGIDIPRYCWHPGLSVVASCRMCLIEAGQQHPQTGEISFIPKLVPACQTPAKDGAVFATDTAKVKNARAQVEEDLLLRHPVDCPICDKSGECYLQDYHFQYGQKERRADVRPFSSRRSDVGPTVTLFIDRCIMCTRCIRFCREVSGTSELMVVNRGVFQVIDVVPGFPLNNKLAGNVVDLCPVGALTDVDFLYQQRVWFMKRHAGVCTRCATGCSVWTEENQDHIYRIKPRENPDVNQWWICDDGRYGFHHVHDEARQTALRRRRPDGLENVLWEDLPQQIHADLLAAGRLAAVLSPHLTVEEAYLLASYSGSYVNYAGRLQSVAWAVRPPAGAWVEGQLYWRLLGRQGLFNSLKVLSEVAAEIPFFARAEHQVPPTGISLRPAGGDALEEEQRQRNATPCSAPSDSRENSGDEAMPMPRPRVAINGLGRIGRATLKVILAVGQFELAAVNDLVSPNRFDGIAIRGPVTAGSLADVVCLTKRDTTVEEVNRIFRDEAASDRYQGILGVTDDPIVSSDVIGDARASIVDLEKTRVVDGNLVKVLSWYDNEWGYASQLVRHATTILSNDVAR